MDISSAAERLKARIGTSKWCRLRDRVTKVNHDIITRGIIPWERTTLLTGYSYGEFYDWDLYFENLYLSHFGESRYCRNNVEAFLDQQLACGFVARTLVNPRLRQHFKPFLCQIALLGCRQTGDYRWLSGRYWERLKKHLGYWLWYSDFDRNGLPVWDSADHSGMDNQDRRAGKINAMEIEGVDLACYLVRECEAMAVLAGRVGHEDETGCWTASAERLRSLIDEVLWDDQDGFYYDRNERTGELVRVKAVSGFIPLWLGGVAEKRAKRLVAEHLLDEGEFWLPYPVATWAKTEPDYYQESARGECNWRGPTWVPTNYMIFHGLVKSGHRDVAGELAYRTLDMALSGPDTREYYNAETGCGQGLNPFWGWSALAYVMPLEYEAEYDPTDVGCEEVVPLAATALGIEL